jgi:O-antigen/teichoic acid export membrane protein
VVNALAAVAYLLIGVRLFRPIDKTAGPSWISIRREILRFAGVAALSQVHSVIAQQATRIIVGAASGVAAAAYYQVPAMLASRVNSGLQRAAYVIFPTASGMYARNDSEGVDNLYLRTSRLFFVVNASVTMAMCAFAYPLLAYWVSVEYAREGALALAVFSLASAVNASTMAASYVNLSAVRPGVNLAFSFSSSCITLLAAYPLTVHWGVTGASLAGLFGSANVPVFFWYVHRSILHLPSRRVWRECYRPSLLANVPLGAAFYLVLAPRVVSLATTLAAFAFACALGMVTSGVFGAVKRDDLRAIRALLHRLLPSGRTPRAPVHDNDDGAG